MQMDLLSFVVQPTWREFLIELVESKQMDPWDLDLCGIADAYLSKVRDLQAIDLRIPANVILASAILLRMKADAFSLEAEPEVIETPLVFYPDEQIPELVYRTNRPRERKLTLDELMRAVDAVLRDGKNKQPIRLAAPKAFSITLPKVTMEQRIADIWQRIQQMQDAERLVAFSDMVRAAAPATGEDETDVFIGHLLPVLHLVNNQQVDAWQDQLFGEIFIKVLDQKASGTEAKQAAIAEAS